MNAKYPRAGTRKRGEKKYEIIDWIKEDFRFFENHRSPLESLWQECWRIYLTNPRKDRTPGRQNATSPHGAHAIRQLIPLIKREILSTRPFILAEARSKEGIRNESTVNGLMDYWIDAADIRHKVLTLGGKESLIFGTALFFVDHIEKSYSATEDMVDEEGVPLLNARGEILTREVDQLWYSGPEIVRIPIEDAYFSPTDDELNDDSTVIFTFIKTYYELLADGRYNRDAVERLKASKPGAYPTSAIPVDKILDFWKKRALGYTDDAKLQLAQILGGRADGLVECLTLVSGRDLYTIGNGTELIREQSLDRPVPLFTLTPDPIPGNPYGKGAFHDSIPSLSQRDYMINAIYDNVGRLVHTGWKINPNLVDEDTLVSRPGMVVECIDLNAAQEIQHPDIVASAFRVLQHLETELQIGSGVMQPLVQVGRTGAVYKESATTSTIEQENALLPVAEIAANWERGLARMARIIWDIEKEYTDQPRMFRIMGREGARFVDVSPQTFVHDYDFRVVGTSFAAARKTEFGTLMGVWDRLFAAAERRPDLVDLKPALRALIRIANVPGLEGVLTGEQRAVGPEQEHQVLKAGHWLMPQPDEDLKSHFETHVAEMKRATQEGEDQGYIERLTDHIAQTEVALRELVSAAMQAQQQGGMLPPEAGEGEEMEGA